MGLTSDNVVEIEAIKAFKEMFLRLKQRPVDAPGLGIFHGPSGFGKTTAAVAWRTQSPAGKVFIVQFDMLSAKTEKNMLAQILLSIDCHVPFSYTAMRLRDTLMKELQVRECCLILDEAHYLKKTALQSILQYLHDTLPRPMIILVGEEKLATDWSKTDRFATRVLSSMPCPQVTTTDIGNLVGDLNVPMDQDLLIKVAESVKWSVRGLIVKVQAIQDWAVKEHHQNLSLQQWHLLPKLEHFQCRNEFLTGTPQ